MRINTADTVAERDRGFIIAAIIVLIALIGIYLMGSIIISSLHEARTMSSPAPAARAASSEPKDPGIRAMLRFLKAANSLDLKAKDPAVYRENFIEYFALNLAACKEEEMSQLGSRPEAISFCTSVRSRLAALDRNMQMEIKQRALSLAIGAMGN